MHEGMAFIALWYVHVPRSVQRSVFERSMCKCVRLNALNALHVHGPCFNAPLYKPGRSCYLKCQNIFEQEFKFFIYLTNWGLMLLNGLLAFEVFTDNCKYNLLS